MTAALAEFAKAAEQSIRMRRRSSANRCVTYAAMGKLDDAIAECNSAIAKYPKNQYAVDNRADAYIRKGNLDAALKDYNTVLADQSQQHARACSAAGRFSRGGAIWRRRAPTIVRLPLR